ncbi:tRNA wybutosine-synthesizing protein 2 [Ophiocordyceps camponoti-floridani]|uniref:tRNA wybutosine-synthesizing protein 2 n=1 Tax=Ophiocordyceps camponoti-floridani TaxID=2030778 RepID=A0A8H4Q4S8_9HYPO|nr:tRNA wybutosine-synthesizing protein 2 [Ophiocordyceps camponoti-floridani]
MHRKRLAGPIQEAVDAWLNSLEAPLVGGTERWREDLIDSAPRRFTVYEPMVLLPAGSFNDDAWKAELRSRDADSVAALWMGILREVKVRRGGATILTHLAVNEAIPRHHGPRGEENILRAPTQLRVLWGDFGDDEHHQGKESFDSALWVSTKQNGIVQTWAPRWTMFSRGNVKEKARLLRFTTSTTTEGTRWAVDLYAGIGYFAFSYVARGMRVLCWEINAWSVEGLRRGARANGWRVRVVGSRELELRGGLDGVLAGGEDIVVFHESNEGALGRVLQLHSMGVVRGVEHVNCGLLPTSEASWDSAWRMASLWAGSCWLHLHENVSVDDIEDRRRHVQRRMNGWGEAEGGRKSTVEHVERVKTFAPGVWHCVFDVHVAAD